MGYDKLKELKYNTIIIAIANIGSNAISFILAPLYSYFLTVEQYGEMDLITTTASLLLPFVCFDIYEASFRFAHDKRYDERKVLSSTFCISLLGGIATLVIIVIIYLVGKHNEYIIYTGLYIFFESINSVIKQFARGRSKMKIFAFTGVLNSVVLLVSNILLMILLHLQLKGWLISFLLAKIVVTIYLMFSTNFINIFSIKKVDKRYIEQFIKFCIPLVPTATMWWIMNASDRYMIAFFAGTAATGIYSVANKLPHIMSVFENVFYQAWQTTAIGALEDNDRDQFYSQVLTNYIIVLSIGTLGLLTFVKPLIEILFAEAYWSAWICLPALILGVIFHAASGNLGSLYTVFKRTKGAFSTTLAGALTNIILNLIFIPWIGISGAAFTTLIGYIVTYVYRWFDIKKFVRLKLDTNKLTPLLFAVVVQCVLYFWISPVSYLLRVLITLFFVCCNYNILLELIKRR